MSKRNSIYSILLLFSLISVCFLSLSIIKTDIEFGDNQENIEPPKTSAYSVTELWNYFTNNELVLSLAVSADGKYMVIGTDTKIIFFNTSDHDGLAMWTYIAGDPIDSIAISENGSYIIAASSSGWGYLLNSTMPDLGKQKEEIWIISGYDEINSVDISRNGKYIIVGGLYSGNPSIFMFNNSYPTIPNNKQDEYLWYNEFQNIVLSVAISADGNYVAAGTYALLKDDNIIFYFNNTDYSIGDEHPPLWCFKQKEVVDPSPIDSISISANGSYIAAGSSKVRAAWLLNSSIPDSGADKEGVWFVFFLYPGIISMDVDISADGKYIVFGLGQTGEEGSVFLFNNSYPSPTGSGKAFEYLWYDLTEGPVNSVSISADGEYITAGTDKIDASDTVFLYHNRDYIWNKEITPTWTFDTGNNVTFVSISASANYFASAGLEAGSSVNGRTSLFYHTKPIAGPGGVDDDDDDDGGSELNLNLFWLLLLIGIILGIIAIVAIVIILKKKK